MKNGDADEELAFMKRRVSFHDDTTSGEATTSNHQPAAVPTFTFEQASPSQSTGTPSLITTFAQRGVAAIRSRKKRKKSRSSFDSHDSMGSRSRRSFQGMRRASNKGGMSEEGRGRRDGLTKTLSKRISLAEKHQIEQEHHNSSWFKWWHAVFVFSCVSVIACLCELLLPYPYGLMMTSTQIADIGSAPDGCEGGLERCICPRETICATDTISIVLLTLARCSAFFDYPLYMMMFLSKCHNINNVCRRTVLREWIDFGDMHKVHRTFGIIVGIETMFHSFFHLLRWGLNSDIHLLWETTTGISGLIAIIITPLICWPMAVPAIKERLAYEMRKGLHYLSIAWAIALLFHSKSRIYYLIGIPGLMYLMDFLFGYFARNSLIENAFFERYGERGVALYFKNPDNWEKEPKTSYVYVMCPWISKYQWHAFTIFPEPSKENRTMLCIESSGDWTKELHRKIKVPCIRPLYVLGPYKSPFSDAAVTTSNAIAVASGIGITPTLSLVFNYAGKKRINVVWACRDPGLVEYILHKFDVGAITKKSYAFIFYTGTRELALPKDLPMNVFVFNGRPHLEHTITGIVQTIHSGDGLPEEMYAAKEKISNAPFEKRMKTALRRVVEIYEKDEMFEYAVEETEKAAAQASSDLLLGSDRTATTVAVSLDENDPEASPLMISPVDKVPQGEVSLKGLDSMIHEFLGGIGEYSRSDIETFFREIDSDGSGFIDRDEFDDFISMITSKDMTASTRSLDLAMERSLAMPRATGHSVVSSVQSQQDNHLLGDESTIEYVHNLVKNSDIDNPLEDWSVFYCGGSNEIRSILKRVTKKYGVDYAVEKFDW